MDVRGRDVDVRVMKTPGSVHVQPTPTAHETTNFVKK